ncbi:proline dehydrogenase [Cladophialophora yegresii CBS 114405]|uniref:Proline dehydrogenase n=1 Tax=Cladophialophora yegresii CBS 114405 TaxID=1182544 RepID=W9WP57_9EURO|nr:proline dehydrogenase [Cladophialophora yegresii CBS 114405]EXJ60199.1 proline dehydrogenase [Cladophialophora yegresii CBS 114405]
MASGSPLSHTSKILIVGGGTWGCSTALHLARRGYTSITVLDAYAVPSPISAGNDLNKILELASFAGEDEDERYVSHRLLEAATAGWLHDPVFQPYFHETGCIVAATSNKARAYMNSPDGPSEADGWIPLRTKEEFRATMPKGVLTGDFPGWQGWWKKSGSGAGWVHARKSMESAAREAARLGVAFVTGDQVGRVTRLIYECSDVKGALTADSKAHYADRTILCAGANAAMLFDMEDQLRPTAWTLAHLKMTPDEAALYRDLPVLFNVERGFFMEPDAEHHELKMCDEHPGYCNWTGTTGTGTGDKSTPFAKHQIPLESEARCRAFLRETMPHLADRPFSFARICWCADTPDRAFLISLHPEYPSLVLGVGGSGHGFAHIPSIGGFIADAMEEKLDERLKHSFRWRPETAVRRDWGDLQGRFGPEGADRVMDFQDIKEDEWTSIGSSAKERASRL